MLLLANIYTLYFRLYFRLCICLNKLSINQSIQDDKHMHGFITLFTSILNICFIIRVRFVKFLVNTFSILMYYYIII